MTHSGKSNCHADALDWFLLDRRRTARAMSISVRLLDHIVKEQRLPFVKCNRRVLFDPRDISLWIEAHKQNKTLEDNTNKEARTIGLAGNVPKGGQLGVTENDSRT